MAAISTAVNRSGTSHESPSALPRPPTVPTTIAVIGAFTIYSVVDSFLSSDHEPMEGLGKGVIVFLSTLPMLFLFLMGAYSLILLLLVDEELERRKKAHRLRVDSADPDNR